MNEENMATSVAALAAEVKERREIGCESCAHLEAPDRSGTRFCRIHGCYDPKNRCAFLKRKS